MSGITDANFTYSVVSATDKTLAITGINVANSTYSASNLVWGAFPAIPATYAGLNTGYNGNGNSANAYKIVEISAYAFDSLTAFSETTISATFLHANLKRIGERAFANVKLKGTLTIPVTIDTVGVKAFYNTLITNIVIGSTTNSDIVPHLGILTSTINQEINDRIAADDSLNLLKAPKDAATFTGTATIPNANIGLATISSASIASANINNANIASASLTTVNVVGNAAFGGNVSTTGAWNFTVQPTINGVLVATESYANVQIAAIAGPGLTTSLDTLGELASAIGNDPSFATNIINAHISISNVIAIETLARSTAVTALSSALSTSAASLTAVDSTLSTALSAETSTRITSVSSLSSALSYAVSSLQSIDIGVSTALLAEVSARFSDVSATSSTLGNAVSSLTSVDSILSTTLSTEIIMRASAVASLAPIIDASAASLTTADVNLNTALSTETSKRISAVASITQPQSTAFASLSGVDSALSTALSTEISTRSGSVSSLSASVSGAADSLQLTNVQFSVALATEVAARSTGISSLSILASASVSAFTSVNSSIRAALSTEVSVRSNAVSSASTSVNNAVVPINASITAQNNALTSETGVRTSQIISMSAGVSRSEASLTTANSIISAALLTEGLTRSNAISAAIENVLSGAPSRFDNLGKIASEIHNNPSITLNSSTLIKVAGLKTSVSEEISARISAVASVSKTAIPSLAAVDSGLITALSTQTVVRGNAVASLSSALSSASVSFSAVDGVFSGALSAETVNRNTAILSVSAAVSTTASTLTANDAALSTSMSAEIVNRQSGVISLVSAMSLSLAFLDITKTTLSLALNTEVSTRTASVASVSGAIATSFASMQTTNNALNASVSTLSAGLALKATTSYLDGNISMMLNGAPSNLNTLVEMAAALGNNPSFASSIVSALSTKADTTAVNSLSTAISAKGGLTEFNSLTSVVSNKANDATITTVDGSVIALNNTVNALASSVNSLQSTLQSNGGVMNATSIQVNDITISDLANRIQELYYNLGTANPSWGIINGDGTINYRINRLANPSIVSSSLGFEYSAGGAVTKVKQLFTVKFDKDQKSATITGGVGNSTTTVNNMVLDSNNNYLFTVAYNGDAAYYTANKLGVTITALENQYKLAPSIPTVTISAPI